MMNTAILTGINYMSVSAIHNVAIRVGHMMKEEKNTAIEAQKQAKFHAMLKGGISKIL